MDKKVNGEPQFKLRREYRMCHRFTFPNGEVGQWSSWCQVYDIQVSIDYWQKVCAEVGRTVEFRTQARVVSDWVEASEEVNN